MNTHASLNKDRRCVGSFPVKPAEIHPDGPCKLQSHKVHRPAYIAHSNTPLSQTTTQRQEDGQFSEAMRCTQQYC